MLTIIKSHFPESKREWKIYFKIFYPMFIATFLYALNGFIDNFMVGHIEQGGTALASINSWTSIIIGVHIGVSSTASFIMAGYYFSNQMEKARQLFKFRTLISLFFGIFFATLAWITPNSLVRVFLQEPTGINADIVTYNKAFENSKQYLRIIAITWILIGINANLDNTLREVGHGKASMYWGIGTIITNISLNSLLMYQFNYGVDGAAWASVAARLFAFSFGIFWLFYKKVPVRFNIFTFFVISKEVVKDFFSKIYLFFNFSFVILFIAFRYKFYDIAYPAGSNTLGKGVSSLSVLALTGAIMNIFVNTFSIAGSMAANIVSKELAQNKTKLAFENAKKLKGFMTTMSSLLGLCLIIIATFVPYMTFLSKSKPTFDNIANLTHVRNSLYVVCLFYPMWIWFITSFRAGSSGKKGLWFSIFDLIISGPLQLGWLALLTYKVIPNSELMLSQFWVTYMVFLSSDILKLISFELLFYKYKWNIPIDKKYKKEIKSKLDNEMESAEMREHH